VGDWPYPYSREQAFFPQQSVREDKYWPPVGRVDNVYGDRHVVCSCPPLEAYEAAAE
jgi:glycine dehydrogenase